MNPEAKELAIMNNLIPSQHEFQVYSLMAKQSAQSGFYKSIGGEAQIMAILLTARELNVSPMLALSGGIWVISGRVEISARMMNMLIRRAGHSLQVKESTDTSCVLLGKHRDNGDSFESAFNMKDAERAGLTRNQTWQKYPKDMLFARALSRLARQLFSDCIGTAYTEKELRDSSYEVIETKEERSQPTEQELEDILISYHMNFDEADRGIATEYIKKYAEHYNTPMHEAILCYERDKLMKDFANWKVKHYPSPAVTLQVDPD